MTSFEFMINMIILMFMSKSIFSPTSTFKLFRKSRDSSDPPGEERSNMKVLVDNKTGREYLAVGTVFGLTSITPRLPAERQILVFPTVPKVSLNKSPAIKN